MCGRIKTSIMVDRELWEEFKSRVVAEKGLRGLSRALEEAVEEEVSDILVARALENMLKSLSLKPPRIVSPVKPRVTTDAGKTVRELRGSRI